MFNAARRLTTRPPATWRPVKSSSKAPAVAWPSTPIPANTPGSLATCGLFTVVKATGAINVGAALFWDADGNPQGGVAGTGCLTTTSTDNTFFGFAAAAAAETDTTVSALLVGVPSVTNTIHNALDGGSHRPGRLRRHSRHR